MAEILGTYVLGTDTIPTLEAGIQNENEANKVKFDISGWKEDFGSGTLNLTILRKGDDNPYPVLLTTSTDDGDSSDVKVWTISNVDTAVVGKHKAQLTYSVDGVRKKTEIFFYRITKSIVASETTPDPYDDWLEDLQDMADDFLDSANALVDEAEGYKDAAMASATAAAGNASTASTKAGDSEAWAVGKRGGVDVESTDATYHNNAKYYAGHASDERSAAESAKTAAQSAQGAAESSQSAAAGSASTASGKATEAANSATAAAQSATAAADSATNAAASAASVLSNAHDSESWAVGKRGGVDVDSEDPAYHNNSEYYSEQAASSASSASGSATTASNKASDSEAWAVGKRGGVDVDSSDDTYHNNAKYFAGVATTKADAAESARGDAVAAKTAAESAKDDAITAKNAAISAKDDAVTAKNGAASSENASNTNKLDSEAYAKGTRGGTAVESDDPAYHNNSKYYSEQAASSASDAESAKDDAESAAQSAASDASAAVDAQVKNAEAWAKGTKGGDAVPSTADQYHNNAKYWSDQAAASVSSLAPAYSSSATYDVGDYVLYSGSLYRCTTAITTAEEWTAAHWTAAKMSEDVSDLKSDLDDLKSYDFVFVGADGNLYYHEEE